MRIAFILFALVAALMLHQASADDLVASSRNISYVIYPILDLFGATAYRWGIFEGSEGEGIIEDALRVVLFQNNLWFAAFQGSAYRSNTNLTDISLAAFAYYIKYEALVEYNETNGVDGLQLGDSGDLILSHYPLWNANWAINAWASDFTFPDQTVGKLYEVSFNTTDNVFSYTIKFTGRPAVVDNVTIDENEFKHGWTIQYYNYAGANGSATGQIALVGGFAITAVAVSSFHTANVSNPTHGIEVLAAGYRGYINYENQADTWDVQAVYAKSGVAFGYSPDYQGFNIAAGGFAGWEAAGVILSYERPHPNLIIHDPEFGTDVPDTPSSTSTTGDVNPSTSGSVNPSTSGSVNPSTTGSVNPATGSTSTTGSKANSAAVAVMSFGLLAASLVAALL